jgi:hypothetical protein
MRGPRSCRPSGSTATSWKGGGQDGLSMKKHAETLLFSSSYNKVGRHALVSRWVAPNDLPLAVSRTPPLSLSLFTATTDTPHTDHGAACFATNIFKDDMSILLPRELRSFGRPVYALRPSPNSPGPLPIDGEAYDMRKLSREFTPVGRVFFRPGSRQQPMPAVVQLDAYAATHPELPSVVDRERKDPCEILHRVVARLVMDGRNHVNLASRLFSALFERISKRRSKARVT